MELSGYGGRKNGGHPVPQTPLWQLKVDDNSDSDDDDDDDDDDDAGGGGGDDDGMLLDPSLDRQFSQTCARPQEMAPQNTIRPAIKVSAVTCVAPTNSLRSHFPRTLPGLPGLSYSSLYRFVSFRFVSLFE